MADLIIKNMPMHKSYLEPFCGSCADLSKEDDRERAKSYKTGLGGSEWLKRKKKSYFAITSKSG